MSRAEPEGGSGGKAPGAFRTIREVSETLDVPQHVLRFWETKFPQVKPLKRGGGRRYYRPNDVALLQRIRELLYAEGYTIRGVQKLLREKGARTLLEPPAPATAANGPAPGAAATGATRAANGPAATGADDHTRAEIRKLVDELLTLRDMLRGQVPTR